MIAIIPARSGSKRIENKNIRPFLGRPIIEYSIRAALKASCFEEVMVSTDDEKIAEIAVKAGAKVPFFRSPETSGDHASTADVVREVLDHYEAEGHHIDAFCCLYATAPFVSADRLEEAALVLSNHKASGAFTCVKYDHPVQRCLVVGDNGRVRPLFPEFAAMRSQDLEPTYYDAGQFYFSTVEAFRESGSLWGPDAVPIIIPENEAQDIDTIEDWEKAEQKFRNYRPHRGRKTAFHSLPTQAKVGRFFLTSYTQMSPEISQMLYRERNNPDVRRMMENREAFSPEDHRKFIEGLTAQPHRRYYAVTTKFDDLIGSLNFTVKSSGRLERGVLISETFRGQGYGFKVLKRVYQWLAKDYGVRVIETKVRRENEASQALEKKLGAKVVRRDKEFIYYETNL